jgi:hypothetical protein
MLHPEAHFTSFLEPLLKDYEKNRGQKLAWDANATTSDVGTNTTGYNIHVGTKSGAYAQTFDAV